MEINHNHHPQPAKRNGPVGSLVRFRVIQLAYAVGNQPFQLFYLDINLLIDTFEKWN